MVEKLSICTVFLSHHRSLHSLSLSVSVITLKMVRDKICVRTLGVFLVMVSSSFFQVTSLRPLRHYPAVAGQETVWEETW